jgi:flagellar motility protein MotE (MotC chaperone)
MKNIFFARLLTIVCLFVALFLPTPSPGAEQAETGEPQFSSVEERRIFAQIKEEHEKMQEARSALDIRENELKTLEASVDNTIDAIDGKLEELKELHKKIEKLLAEKTNREKERIKKLSLIYEKMAPGRAALAMTGMEPQLATELLAGMKPKAAAKILDMLKKQKTSELSTEFTTLQIE